MANSISQAAVNSHPYCKLWMESNLVSSATYMDLHSKDLLYPTSSCSCHHLLQDQRDDSLFTSIVQ